MNIESFPFNLYKANVELQLRIAQFLQEGRRNWIESTRQCHAGAGAATEQEMENLAQSANWQALVSLSPKTFGRLLEAAMSGTQTMHQTMLKNQTASAAGFQQALEDWRKSVTGSWASACSAQSLQSIFTPMRAPIAPATHDKSTQGA